MSSVAERVAAGVVTVLSGLAWGAGVTPKVVSRKKPAVTPADGCTPATPTVIVVVQRGKAVALMNGARPKVMATYSVGVAIAIPSPNLLGDVAAMLTWVELARKAVHGDGTLPGVPETNEIFPSDQVPWDPGALDRNFEWGVLGFEVEAIENRS